MKIFGVLCFILISIVVMTLLRGYILMKMWLWFITPAFNLPALTLLYSIGFGLVVSYLVTDFSKSKASSKEDKNQDGVYWITNLVSTCVIHFGIFGIAYIIHLFY